MIKIILILGTLLIVISLVFGACKSTPAPAPEPATTPTPTPTPTETQATTPALAPMPTPASPPAQESAPAPATIKITAAELNAEYEANEIRADARYKGKLVEVSGFVTDIGTSRTTGQAVICIAGSPDDILSAITAYISDDYKAKVAIIDKGHKVIVMGICEGVTLVRGTEQFGLSGVRLKDCSVFE